MLAVWHRHRTKLMNRISKLSENLAASPIAKQLGRLKNQQTPSRKSQHDDVQPSLATPEALRRLANAVESWSSRPDLPMCNTAPPPRRAPGISPDWWPSDLDKPANEFLEEPADWINTDTPRGDAFPGAIATDGEGAESWDEVATPSDESYESSESGSSRDESLESDLALADEARNQSAQDGRSQGCESTRCSAASVGVEDAAGSSTIDSFTSKSRHEDVHGLATDHPTSESSAMALQNGFEIQQCATHAAVAAENKTHTTDKVKWRPPALQTLSDDGCD